MKPPLLLLTLIISINSCKEINTDSKQDTGIDRLKKSIQGAQEASNRLDTSINALAESQNRLFRAINYLDSNRKYYQLAKESEVKMLRSEANYYRTGDKKFYNAFYKHKRDVNRYAKITNLYSDSLKNN